MCRAFMAVVLAALLGASCGSGPGTSLGKAPAASTPSPRSTTTRPPSALDDLTSFLKAAGDVDTKLRAAARAVNGGIGTNQMAFDQSMVDAVNSANPDEAAAAIPAGLPPALLQSVLIVYNDLASRRSAFNGVKVGALATSDYDYNLRCLRNGAPAAARFAADVTATRNLAATFPPLEGAAPDSPSARELAVRIQWIRGNNNGCASCGGFVIEGLVPITWYGPPVVRPGDPMPVDGNINGVDFSAHYVAGKGWDIVLHAC